MGLLNIFLWGADLWFLYKETMWFQNRGGIVNQPMGAMGQPDMQQDSQYQVDQFQGQEQFQGQPDMQQQQQYYAGGYDQQQQQQQMGGYSQQGGYTQQY